MGVAIAHHDAQGHLLEEAVQVVAVQLHLAQQLGDTLVAALVLAVREHVAHAQSRQRGDVLEAQALDAAIVVHGEVESLQDQHLRVVGE